MTKPKKVPDNRQKRIDPEFSLKAKLTIKKFYCYLIAGESWTLYPTVILSKAKSLKIITKSWAKEFLTSSAANAVQELTLLSNTSCQF